jgi:hypothetical protein
MARVGPSLSLSAALSFGIFCCVARAADDRITSTLEVQAALQQGRTHLLRGDYAAAVHVLESQIARIDGQQQYLLALRDAYRGLIKSMKMTGRDAEAAIYVRRLLILDPGSSLDYPQATGLPSKGAPPRPAPEKKEEKAAPIAPPLVRLKSADEPPPRPVIDPFSEANHRRADEARGYLEQAEKFFQSERFVQAGEFYAKASEAMPESLKDARERWAYCKLHQVNERLTAKEQKATAADLAEMEQQVRWAIGVMPKLEASGKLLLANIEKSRNGGAEKSQQDAAPEIVVKHSRAPGAKWALADTPNFRIFHNLDQAQAEKIARIAETTRTSMQKKWFGQVSPDWEPRCDLYIHENAESYARETGQSQSTPGHATISSKGERIISRRLDMRLDAANMLDGVLPHETTHVVLAGRFGPNFIPRWADEGMAMLTQPREQLEVFLKNLPAHRSESELFTVQQLMEMKDFPQRHLHGMFYAQSLSVVDYLTSLRGPQEFVAFLNDGLRTGYEAALRKHYGIAGYQALQTQWESFAFKQSDGGMARRGE